MTARHIGQVLSLSNHSDMHLSQNMWVQRSLMGSVMGSCTQQQYGQFASVACSDSKQASLGHFCQVSRHNGEVHSERSAIDFCIAPQLLCA